jgi:hypothetical protein
MQLDLKKDLGSNGLQDSLNNQFNHLKVGYIPLGLCYS